MLSDSRLRILAPYFLLTLGVFLAYANIYGNAFLYDDPSLIVDNQYLRGWDHFGAIFSSSVTSGANVTGGFYRPMQTLVYLIVFHLFGPSPIAFHIPNIALHAANACLVYLLGRRLGFHALGTFAAALLWALHPAHVEAITYMSGTADPLYVFFTLAGLCILFPHFGWRRIFYALPLFLLALLSKETAILFPLLVCVCLSLKKSSKNNNIPETASFSTPFLSFTSATLWCRVKKIFRNDGFVETYLPTLPLWIVTGLYLIVHKFFLTVGAFNLYTLHNAYAQNILVRIYTFLGVIPSYLKILLWPTGLHFDRDFQPILTPLNADVLNGVFIIAVMMIPFFIHNKTGAILRWAVMWFVAADVLHSGILVAVNAVLLEHWLYLPSVGFFLAGGDVLFSAAKTCLHRNAALILTGTLAVVLATLTFAQNRTWKNEETLYGTIFANGEPSPHAHNNLAIVYTKRGEYAKAIEQFRLAIQLSGDNNAQAEHNLAITLLNGPEGPEKTDEAIDHFKRALAIDPTFYPASAALAAMYHQKGDADQAAFYQAKTEEIRKNMGFQPR